MRDTLLREVERASGCQKIYYLRPLVLLIGGALKTKALDSDMDISRGALSYW